MHEVIFKSQPKKFLKKQSRKTLQQLRKRTSSLGVNPIPDQSTILRENPKLRRIKTGDYRIVYHIDDKKAEVIIVRIGNRRDVYDRVKKIKVPES